VRDNGIFPANLARAFSHWPAVTSTWLAIVITCDILPFQTKSSTHCASGEPSSYSASTGLIAKLALESCYRHSPHHALTYTFLLFTLRVLLHLNGLLSWPSDAVNFTMELSTKTRLWSSKWKDVILNWISRDIGTILWTGGGEAVHET
jgi:hypothetical protein